MRGIGRRIHSFARRRYYRNVNRFQPVLFDLELLECPREVVSGCMYKVPVRVTNRSGKVLNRSGDSTPLYSVAMVLKKDRQPVLEGPHTVLPNDLAPGQSCEIVAVLEVPLELGKYEVHLDVVRESCFWLSETKYGKVPTQSVVVSAHADTLFEERIPTLDVTLDVTNKCPLKCIQCRKTYFETFDEQQDMNYPLFKQIAADLFPHARTVCLSSAGEPLMTRNFLDAVALARSYGVEVSFISSGMHLDHNRAEKLIDLKVSRIEFSLDGATAPTYNKIRIGSNFDKVIRNISYLNELKQKKGCSWPMLRFNYVLMKSNIHELPEFIELAHRLGVVEVQTQHMVIFTNVVRDEALVFHKELSNRYVEEARKRAQQLGIRFFHPPLFTIQSDQAVAAAPMVDGKIFMQENENDFERKTHPIIPDGMQLCTDPWRKLFIDWQGQVFPCCVWKEQPLGDLRTNGFKEIWHSPAYRNLRAGLTTGNLGKSCAECSVITGGNIDLEQSYVF